MTRKTKIISTVGPSIHSKEAINEIIDAGANVLRLNFSHGSNDEYKQIVDWARSSNKKIAIMQDIQGPKIRTGFLEESFDLSQGAEIEISNKDSKKNNENIVINYEHLHFCQNAMDSEFSVLLKTTNFFKFRAWRKKCQQTRQVFGLSTSAQCELSK